MTGEGKAETGVPDDAPTVGVFGVLVAIILSFSAQIALLVGLAEGRLPGGGWGFFVGHGVLAAALAAWTVWRGRRGLDQRFPGLLAMTALFLGPGGPPCTLLCLIMHGVFRRYATGFHDWYLSLFPESEVAPARELYELIVTGREQAGAASVESFTDVMTVGSPQQKQAVIALVSRHFRPSFTPALKLGLADADPSVRVQAATATARVEHEFNEKWQRLEHAAHSHPDDPAARRELARHLDEYAFCGLLDANREQELQQKALDQYRQALAMAFDDADLRNDLGRLLLRVGLVEEAAETLAPAAAHARDRRLLAWYAESLFRLRRFDDLRALCADRRGDMGGRTSVFDALGDVVALWTADVAADGAGDGAAAAVAAPELAPA